VTTLSINALGPRGVAQINPEARRQIREWLLSQQFQREHPYTHAAPGAWAWTNLPGGVPDADDTAGALLALRVVGSDSESTREAGRAGVAWLLNLQNRDGGIPTFCRGWGALPFDRSGADLTAHAIQAWLAWLPDLAPAEQRKAKAAIRRALAYLAQVQRSNGAWAPLWFGNQYRTGEENLVYGTSRVLLALAEVHASGFARAPDLVLERGVQWLVNEQNANGSWGSNGAGSGTVEESALGLESLAAARPGLRDDELQRRVGRAVAHGASWLVERVEQGQWIEPAPIGFYFAKLWYYERLYPILFTVGALQRNAADADGKA
jgi:squalene-hopene/tetraprenyl-beta-curcumene cyclase